MELERLNDLTGENYRVRTETRRQGKIEDDVKSISLCLCVSVANR